MADTLHQAEEAIRPLPCPFCGGTVFTVAEGSTFRWRVPMCPECGASCGEVRIQTMGDGTQEEWEADVRKRAIIEWNRRPSQDADARDAARYREMRRKVCIVGDKFHVVNLAPTYVAPDAAIELDAAIDSAMAQARKEGGNG